MNKWPKKVSELTEEQKIIREDFMHYWHEVLPKKYNIIEKFNHGYSIDKKSKSKGRTLEIGSGLGEHIKYENLEDVEYFALELREDMAKEISRNYSTVNVVVADCQISLPFEDLFFDRIMAINVLEHLDNLPACLKEVNRVLKKDGDFFCVIPCENGFLYNIARKISAEKIFKKRYKQSYDWFVASEHLNLPNEIINELSNYFKIINIKFFPLSLKSINLNLVIGITLKRK